MAAKKNSNAAPELPAFAGFAKRGVSFFHALAVSQSRDWVHAHKGDYEGLWKQPMLSLLTELQAPLAKIYKYKLSPPKLFRLNRDVRFSKDKSPYKTSCSGMLRFEGAQPMQGAAIYIQLGLDEDMACGFYELDPDRLAQMRKQVLSEKSGAKLATLLEAATAKGQVLVSMNPLKRAPSGIAKDHPRVEILKHKGLALNFPAVPKQHRYSASLKDWLIEQSELAAPIVRWGFENKLA
jgi:uncharacterized protein (TIGR02453 family)